MTETQGRHLWGHFSPLRSGDRAPTIIKGVGCNVWDTDGKRYLDALAGLYTVQVGHGRRELAEAAGTQAQELAYFPLWTYTHPTGVRLAEEIAARTPGDLNRIFFTTGGGEAVESAWKLARQYFETIGEPHRDKIVGRHLAYHGTSMGALAITGLPSIKTVFEPLTPGALHIANTNRYRCATCASLDACPLTCADELEVAIEREGPDTVAAVIVEPVQNAGGCFTPPDGYFARLREICDRHGILLISDEVICAFGRLGEWFGSERYGYQPDMITMAKGITSGYSPLGAVAVSDRIADAFIERDATFLHGYTFGGHPVSCAVGLANIEVFEADGLLDNVRSNEATFRAALESLRDIPIVGDIRGTGYFYGIELVKDRDTKETFGPEESEELLRGFLSTRLLDLGLICRTDDRGDPVIQLSPPLVAGPPQFDEITDKLTTVLREAQDRR